MLKNTVLLLKSNKENEQNDEYENLLTNKGYYVKKCKTLIFKFKNLDLLKQKLHNSNIYTGIIFTSSRCVQAVNLAMKDKTELREWQSKHNFVVGPSTFKDASEKLQLTCLGKEAGNAARLSEIILEGIF